MFDVPQKPLYRIGDTLYVRETWARIDEDVDPIWFEEPALLHRGQIIYRAEYPYFPECRWRPSIHMPREAARIFLRVTDVRVERLQDITKWQAVDEGQPECCGLTVCGGPSGCHLCEASGENSIKWFSNVWDSTVKKADLALYGWEANPYVWVIEFERISREGAVSG